VLSGLADTDVRAMSFTTLVVANLGLIFVNRSWTHTVVGGLRDRNAALWTVAGGTLATLALLLWLPFTQRLFGFAALNAANVGIGASAGVLSVLWFEGYKLILGRRHLSVA
jgi:Ca2+-transporting ATPase